MSKELFWNNLERSFADEDNAQFDNRRAAQKSRRKVILGNAAIIAGLLLAVFATFFVAGSIIFRLMPAPKQVPTASYSQADRADLTSLVRAFK